MQTLEKEVENTTVRRKRSEKNSEKKLEQEDICLDHVHL